MKSPPTPSNRKTGLRSREEVSAAMIRKIEGSLLDRKDAKALGFDPYTEKEILSKHPNLSLHKAGFTIPYFDTKGRRTKFWRYRLLESSLVGFAVLTDTKVIRYLQPRQTLNELYLPPFVDWEEVCADIEKPIVITEGELKAACATKHGPYPTIGLGGVWCFRSGAQRQPLLAQFGEFLWKDRVVYIAYDSDAATNPMVVSAENALARELTFLGAHVHIVRVTRGANDAKAGLDDYISARGVEAYLELLSDAAEWRAAQELFKLNEEVVYVSDPGIIMRLDTLQRMTPRAFVDHAYAPRIYYEEQHKDDGKVKLVERSAPKEWLKWPMRYSAARVTYAPGFDRMTPNGELNVWPGWKSEPKRGDVTPWRELLDYLFAGEKEARKWFEQWCACPIQMPGVKMYSCVNIWGLRHGTGKSLVGYTLFEIYGSNATEITDEQLHSHFNEWAENKQFVMGDEITGGDKRSVADRMKSMITQRSLRLNPKYVPSYTVPDCINYYFTSNHPDSFFLEDDDRRFFIHEVRSPPKDLEFYQGYERWMKSKEGIAALHYHLLNVPLEGFEPQMTAPITRSKIEMIDGGRSDLSAWVNTLKSDPDTILRMDSVVLPFALWRAEDLLAVYDPTGKYRVTANGLARELKRAGFERPAGSSGVHTSLGQVRLWAIRTPQKFLAIKGAELGKMYDNERSSTVKRKPKL